ncbi:MAG: ferritin [Candidatus Omnitrophota bacterium]
MLSKNLAKALNYQVNREIYSGYFYLGMAAYAASLGLKGFANWFKIQFKEELFHADKLFDYIISQGNKVILEDIETPPQDFTSAPELFKRTLEHEKKVTGLINGLVSLAKAEKDEKTAEYLQWFVKEQMEEEAAPAGILEKIKSVGTAKEGLAKIDLELTERK